MRRIPVRCSTSALYGKLYIYGVREADVVDLGGELVGPDKTLLAVEDAGGAKDAGINIA